MNNIVIIVKKGGMRKTLAKIAKKNGYWVEQIDPADFETYLLEIAEKPKGKNVQYEYIISKLEKMGEQLGLMKSGCLIVSNVSQCVEEMLKEDLGAFSSSELSTYQLSMLLEKESSNEGV